MLTSAERVLVHLHASWNAPGPGGEATQAGIADGAQIARSHVPRTVKALIGEGLVEARQARILGHTRRTTVYALTATGMARAREILDGIDGTPAEVDGRVTSLGEARRILGLAPLEAIAALDERGRLGAAAPPMERRALIQRDEDLAFLKRWRAGPAAVAVVYGARGMGKTALAREFSRTVTQPAWIDVGSCKGVAHFSAAVELSLNRRARDPEDPEAVAGVVLGAFDDGTQLLVLDGYGEVSEGIVDVLATFVRLATDHPRAKLLVLAQETTPAYCRFFSRKEVDAGVVAERHLKGLDSEGCREMLGNPSIPQEDLRRIYLLTKGCPLYLQFIREGDEHGLRQNSRFTKAEVRLLLYSRGASD